MSIRSWVRSWSSSVVVVRRVVQPPAQKGEALAAAEAPVQEQRQQIGNFVTPASVATFSGATTAIATIWNIIELVLGLHHTLILGLVISGLVAYCFWDADATTPAQQKAPRPTTKVRILCAVVNMVFLFSAASGSRDVVVQLAASAAANNAPAQSTSVRSQPSEGTGSQTSPAEAAPRAR